jgi:hypothetical protein
MTSNECEKSNANNINKVPFISGGDFSLYKMNPESLLDLALHFAELAVSGALENPQDALRRSEELFSLAVRLEEHQISDIKLKALLDQLEW